MADEADKAEVTVTPEMKRAGLGVLRERCFGDDLSAVSEAVYMAMEYERLWGLGKLGGIRDEAFKVSDG